MNKIPLAIISFTCLVLGVFIGVFSAFQFGSHFVSRGTVADSASDVIVTVMILDRIRGGDLNGGIDLLEKKLDGSTIILGAFLKSNSNYADNPGVRRALKSALSYRQRYSHQTENPEVDKAVTEALQR